MDSEERLKYCSVDGWTKAMKRAACEHRTIELPQGLVDRILKGGPIRVPETHWTTFAPSQLDRTDMDEEDEEEGDEEKDQNDGDEEETEYATFPEWEKEVDRRISELGGAVFPKLNWSSPKDAVWMSKDGTLRCTDASEVLLFLLSSDYALSDVEQARALGVPPMLVLWEWHNVPPASEFRCFVLGKRAVAICQRNLGRCFPSLLEMRTSTRDAISRFITNCMLPAFPLEGYFVDVMVDGELAVKLIDVAPLDEGSLVDMQTLISWDELVALRSSGCEFAQLRLVESNTGIQPGSRNLCGVPTDLRDATSYSDVANIIRSMEREHYTEVGQAPKAADDQAK